MEPLLRVRDLHKHFQLGSLIGPGRRMIRAVDGVSLDLARGQTLGLVGESGCGKTTMGRLMLGLDRPTSGSIHLADSPNLTRLSPRQWFPWRRRIQMVFQDPYSSLNPRMTVASMLAEPLAVHGLASRAQSNERVVSLLHQVGLPTDSLHRFPHELSGGQRQRVGIARALAVEPDLIIADEPVSALDVSIQAQIINLLGDIQKKRGVSFIFIAHDLGVVGHISHRVAVMYLGRIVEIGSRDAIFDTPRHPYTHTLLRAIPEPDPAAATQPIANPPEPEGGHAAPSGGCAFYPRCPIREEKCFSEAPSLTETSPGHSVSCWKAH